MSLFQSCRLFMVTFFADAASTLVLHGGNCWTISVCVTCNGREKGLGYQAFSLLHFSNDYSSASGVAVIL